MNNSEKITSLEMLLIDLIENTLSEIRLYRKESPLPENKHFIIAEYLLQESMEYVAGAFDMIKSGKTNASIALARWPLEASLNLLWVVTNEEKIDERLNILCGEALRNEVCLLDGLAKIWPDKCQMFEEKANIPRKIREEFGGKKLRLKNLDTRLKNVEENYGKNNEYIKALYPIYRVCCSSAHPSVLS